MLHECLSVLVLVYGCFVSHARTHTHTHTHSLSLSLFSAATLHRGLFQRLTAENASKKMAHRLGKIARANPVHLFEYALRQVEVRKRSEGGASCSTWPVLSCDICSCAAHSPRHSFLPGLPMLLSFAFVVVVCVCVVFLFVLVFSGICEPH